MSDDIWRIDQATICEQIRERNALRRSAQLPLLDEQKELDHACMLIRQARWSEYYDSLKVVHKEVYERMRDEVLAQRGGRPPDGWISRLGFHHKVETKFRAYVSTHYRKEFDDLKHIAENRPNYLDITREVIHSS